MWWASTDDGCTAHRTVRLLNRHYGTQQEFPSDTPKTAAAVAKWARAVHTEWRWLFANAKLQALGPDDLKPGGPPPRASAFHRTGCPSCFGQHCDTCHNDRSNTPVYTHLCTHTGAVLGSEEFWVVLLLDGLECGPCKTAKTNMLRLSAGISPLGLGKVGFLDCQPPDRRELCYNHLGLPAAPHAPQVRHAPGPPASAKLLHATPWPPLPRWPTGMHCTNRFRTHRFLGAWQVRAWQAGPKVDGDKGPWGHPWVLYNANEIEPHLALQLTELVIRLSHNKTTPAAEEESGLATADGSVPMRSCLLPPPVSVAAPCVCCRPLHVHNRFRTLARTLAQGLQWIRFGQKTAAAAAATAETTADVERATRAATAQLARRQRR